MTQLDGYSLAEKKELLGLLLEKEKSENAHRLDRYVPHSGAHRGQPNDGQASFHKSDKRIRLCLGGNQSGKTIAGAIEAIWYALGTHPHKKIKVPNRGRIIASLGFEEGAAQTIIPKILEWLPDGVMKNKPKNNQAGIPAHWTFNNGSVINILSGEQEGKVFEGWTGNWCWGKGSNVLMADGSYKPIEKIEVGDEVFSFYNNMGIRRTNKVSHVMNRQSATVRVTTRYGYDFVCTPDHKLWTSGGGWVEAKDLKPGHKLISPSDEFGANDFDLKKALWLGLMIGDGSFPVDRTPYFTCFNDELLEFSKQNLFDDLYLSEGDRRQFRVSHSNDGKINSLKALAEEYDLLGRKAHEKRVHPFFFSCKKEVVQSLLTGLFSTDGWCSGACVGYASTCRGLVYDIQRLLLKFGIRSAVYYRPSKIEEWRDQWHLHIKKSYHVLTFLNEIQLVGKNISLVKEEALRRENSKFERCVWEGDGRDRESNRHQADRLVSVKNVVENIASEDVYDITVERDHNFICEGVISSNCWIDEPCREHIYAASRRGLLRNKGDLWMTLTPLSEPWIYHELYEPWMSGEREDISCHMVDIWDNAEENGGHLSRESIEAYERDLSDDVKESRMHGKFRFLSGRVYPEYNPDTHIVKSFKIPSNWPVWEGIDPHLRKEHAYCQWAISPDGDYYVCNEIYQKFTIPQLADAILEMRKGLMIVNTLIDNSSETPDSIHRITPRRMLEQKGIRTRLAQKHNNVFNGIHQMRDLLTPKPTSTGEDRPRFFVMEHCKRHQKEFLNYVQDDRDTEFIIKDKPRKIWDDMMDLDRYFVVEGANYKFNPKPVKVSKFRYGSMHG